MNKLSLLLLCILSTTVYCQARQLPSVQLKDINGKTVRTDKLHNNGKPFIISFFATWCKPCLEELEAIGEVYDDWRAETGVKLVAVSIDDAQNAMKVGPAARAKGWEYEVLLDPNSDFKRALGANMVPAVFVVDGNGAITFSRTGYTSGSEEHLIEEVRKLTAKVK